VRGVTVVRTGAANLASVAAALARAGARVSLTSDPEALERASRLVLPGVGAFGRVMARLRAAGLAEALADRFADGRPALAICLGMQLLAEASEEDPGTRGLGVLPGRATRFAPTERTPQLGWNRVTADTGCRLLADGAACFANSYKLDAVPEGWSGARSDHGGPFVAALERGPVLACQFHPELSGPFGATLLERWLRC
jgi:glutamine amidotransferase